MKSVEKMRKLSWLCFTLMWIPFIGIFVGMSSMPAGDYSFSQLPMLAQVSMIVTGVLFALMMILSIVSAVVRGVENQEVMENGVQAEAKVLKVTDTGETINNNPTVRFLLEVQPVGQAPFQAEAERTISRLEVVRPGDTVTVKFDPQSKEVAIIDQS